MMRILDSHHHIWDYDPTQYPWIPLGTPLAENYGFNDLANHSAGTGVVGGLVVQARQSLEETQWLLALAQRDPLCKGVVGWVPLEDEAIGEIMGRFYDNPQLKGVRCVIEDQQDPASMLSPALLHGIRTIAHAGLCCDVLVTGQQRSGVIRMVDALPDGIPLVLDHLGKPAITPGRFDEQWALDIAELARRPHVSCKLSGLVTQVRGAVWDQNLLKPYVEHALACFGPKRLMFGSGWPVALMKTDYPRWVLAVRELIAGLSSEEQEQILYTSAASFYGVG